MVLLLYGQRYVNATGTLITPRITFPARNSYEYYSAYEYSGDPYHVGTKPLAPSKNRKTRKEETDELLARARRTCAFADASGLAPTDGETAMHYALIRRAERAFECDHLSTWISPEGTAFLLTEPYPHVFEDIEAVESGLLALQVPINLSPYCGGWNPMQGALPGTRSYLICDAVHGSELAQILTQLRVSECTAPTWNDTSGISHDE